MPAYLKEKVSEAFRGECIGQHVCEDHGIMTCLPMDDDFEVSFESIAQLPAIQTLHKLLWATVGQP